MSKRVVITQELLFGRRYRIIAFIEDNRLLEVNCEDVEEHSILGNVYIGKVKRIIEKIDAVFVEIAPGQMTYLPLREAEGAMMVKQCRQGKLTEEDEIVVQVVKEAVKTKDPNVSTNISIKGNALILTTGNKKLGVSKKLESEKRNYFQSLLEEKKGEDFGLIVRTNAGNYSDEQILAEYYAILDRYEKLRNYYKHRTCYSCLYHEPSKVVASVRDYLSMNLEKIVTDDLEVYEELHQVFSDEAALKETKMEFYEDSMLSLTALYGLKSKLEEALNERVWLKSGAYLVIQPTEALTVIDVNSGKCIKGKQKDFYLKINLEAAEEIARQLRLRNISGICLVDFINMDTKEAEEVLSHALKRYLAKDTVPAVFVDFTKLGLAEITRKKVKKPLWEQIGDSQ